MSWILRHWDSGKEVSREVLGGGRGAGLGIWCVCVCGDMRTLGCGHVRDGIGDTMMIGTALDFRFGFPRSRP